MRDLKVLDNFRLKVQIPIAWADMDILGHVNSSKYFMYFETTRIKYYEKLGVSQFFESNNIYPVVSLTECSYLIPLSYPDTLVVGAKVTELTNESLVMEYFINSNLLG